MQFLHILGIFTYQICSKHKIDPLEWFRGSELVYKVLSFVFVWCLLQKLCLLPVLSKIQDGRQNGRQRTPWDNISQWEHLFLHTSDPKDSRNVN